MYVDKYRPKHLKGIVCQREITSLLEKVIETSQLPHLLFFGPSGTGKTSTIITLAKKLFGSHFSNRVLELNASDDRGINIVRTKIMNFAKKKICDMDDLPPFKIIILDEADAMTTEAQSALRKLMETYSKTTRFCLICNYKNKIIDPIVSRCMSFRYRPISKEQMRITLTNIAEKEEVKTSDADINVIIKYSDGDLRKAINQLQNLKYSSETITEHMNAISQDEIKNILTQTTDVEIIKNVKKIINSSSNLKYVLDMMCEYILGLELDENVKRKVLIKLSETESNILKGGDEELQLLNFLFYYSCLFH